MSNGISYHLLLFMARTLYQAMILIIMHRNIKNFLLHLRDEKFEFTQIKSVEYFNDLID